MRHQRALDLGRAEAVAGDVDHVVDAAGDPVEPVRVAAGAVTGEVAAGEAREIRFDKALVVAEHGAHLAGPGARQAQIALDYLPWGALQFIAVAIDDDRLDAEERPGRRARLQRRRARQRRD